MIERKECIPFQCSNLTVDDSSVDIEKDSKYEGIYVNGSSVFVSCKNSGEDFDVGYNIRGAILNCVYLR